MGDIPFILLEVRRILRKFSWTWLSFKVSVFIKVEFFRAPILRVKGCLPQILLFLRLIYENAFRDEYSWLEVEDLR